MSCRRFGCNFPEFKEGFCGKHYEQWTRSGYQTRMEEIEKMKAIPKCKAVGCIREKRTMGYCQRHLDLFNRGVKFKTE